MSKKELTVINLIGGPGAGKSTNAAGLFFLMKKDYANVELVNEYAKGVVWAERFKLLQEQAYILAKQNHMLHRLRDQVEFAITDAPLFLSLLYAGHAHENFPVESFKKFAFDVFNTYNNLTFYIHRTKKYVPIGRSQTEEESDQISKDVLALLKEYNVPFIEILPEEGEDACHLIYRRLNDMGFYFGYNDQIEAV